MSKSNVNPNHYKTAGRERQGEDIVQARHKQKHAKALVRQRTEIGTSRKPAPQGGSATKQTRISPEGAATRKRSTAQKRGSSRRTLDPIPATNAAARALGRGPSPRRLPLRK